MVTSETRALIVVSCPKESLLSKVKTIRPWSLSGPRELQHGSVVFAMSEGHWCRRSIKTSRGFTGILVHAALNIDPNPCAALDIIRIARDRMRLRCIVQTAATVLAEVSCTATCSGSTKSTKKECECVHPSHVECQCQRNHASSPK